MVTHAPKTMHKKQSQQKMARTRKTHNSPVKTTRRFVLVAGALKNFLH
jgi:hypothetical protein